jgi:hypothetical protein
MTSGSLNYLAALVDNCTSMQWLEENADAGVFLPAPE